MRKNGLMFGLMLNKNDPAERFDKRTKKNVTTTVECNHSSVGKGDAARGPTNEMRNSL